MMKIEATATDYCMTIQVGSDWLCLTRDEAMQLEEEISANLYLMAVPMPGHAKTIQPDSQ